MRAQSNTTISKLIVINDYDGRTEVVAKDNAPSGSPLINMWGGRWEIEAIWVLKAARTVDDW